jgi:hypothetical protein
MNSVSDLVADILEKLYMSGTLQEIMLIGSWCLPVYQSYFNNSPMVPVLRTTDIDFMIPYPPKIKTSTDIPALLETLGFIEDIDTFNRVIKFIHRDLEIEFLMPEVGPPKAGELWIPELRILPQRLRFLSILQENQLQGNFRGTPVTVPEPAAFVIQKFICSADRMKKDKKDNDLRVANELGLFLLMDPEQKAKLNGIYHSLLPQWRKRFTRIISAETPKFFESFQIK